MQNMMLSKRYESTEVDRELAYLCPRGLLGKKAICLYLLFEYFFVIYTFNIEMSQLYLNYI